MEIKDLSWNEVISKRFNHPLFTEEYQRNNCR